MIIRLIVLIFTTVAVLMFAGCSGGGADVGNPIMGTVYVPSTGNPEGMYQAAVAGRNRMGARVILSKRGADPGLHFERICQNDGSFEICSELIFFDTTYTDENGVFFFDTLYPGSYVLCAEYEDIMAMEYVSIMAYQEPEAVDLYCAEPVRLDVRTYDPFNAEEVHFIGIRVAGTGYMDTVDSEGTMVIQAAPAHDDLDLILYRSDGEKMPYHHFKADIPGCHTQLYVDPHQSEEYWTPHVCNREYNDRPYVLEYTPSVGEEALQYENESYDILISFSHGMNTVHTSEAISVFSSDASVTLRRLKWHGGDALYIAFCVDDREGGCRAGDDRFRENITYGVAIDTTAVTTAGVAFAHPDTIRFTP
jgi:hypothetical protein